MKKIWIGLALTAFLIIASLVTFGTMQDAIITYVREQSEQLVTNSFITGINRNEFRPSDPSRQPARNPETAAVADEDALHQILRQIALCR